ncbi:hypothetical protein Tco_0383403 [Tanacetum coccineum]
MLQKEIHLDVVGTLGCHFRVLQSFPVERIEQGNEYRPAESSRASLVWLDTDVVEELDNMNVLQVISAITLEISVFLVALNKQNEQQRLYQFLNGLEDHFRHQRSQILMIVPLPHVENAFPLLQQEESQRMLFSSFVSVESTTLLSKGNLKDKCSICGFKWHPP